MSGSETFGPVARERAQARELLRVTCEKLGDGLATPDDHRPALEAILVLPMDEAEHWMEQIRVGFIEVYARAHQAGEPDEAEDDEEE